MTTPATVAARAPRLRGAFSALEVLLASVLLAAALIPVVGSIQQSQHVAYLDEFHVLARRRALRAHAVLATHAYEVLQAAADGAPPPDLSPELSPDAKEIFLPLSMAAKDITLENLPPASLKEFRRRAGSMPVRAYLEPLEDGFGRLCILVTWVDPANQQSRHLVLERLVEDPFRWATP